MFTGIVEAMGRIEHIGEELGNLHFTIRSSISDTLKIDQSVAHNGVCLTVVALAPGTHTVTAIQETLRKTSLKKLREGDPVNLERCMKLGDRLDGHIVQGHVDQTAECIAIREERGSYLFTFLYDPSMGNVTVEKGSVCVNGTSLTVVNSEKDRFSVAIIPYTFEHTVFHTMKVHDMVNLEFDILGKYIARLLHNRGI